MFNSKLFFRETVATASFALREYFRPLVGVARFLKARLAPAKLAEDQASPDETCLKKKQLPQN